MRSLLKHLPRRDQSLGEQFIQNRQFESLQELIDSAIYKTKKNISSDNPRQEYLEVDLDELRRLKSEVDVYVSQLDLPNNEEDYDDEEPKYIGFGY